MQTVGVHLDGNGSARAERGEQQLVRTGTCIPTPCSLGFVHIDEGSNLSEALQCFFLPGRKKNLDAFAASPPVACNGPILINFGLKAKADEPAGKLVATRADGAAV